MSTENFGAGMIINCSIVLLSFHCAEIISICERKMFPCYGDLKVNQSIKFASASDAVTIYLFTFCDQDNIGNLIQHFFEQ